MNKNTASSVWIRFDFKLSDPAICAGLHLTGDKETHARTLVNIAPKYSWLGDQIAYISVGSIGYNETIIVPVLYMGRERDIMILMWATSITRAIGKCGPWKSRLFWALKWQWAKRVTFGPKKVFCILYFHDRSAYILLQEICGPILEIYQSLTDTWMWKLGLRPRNSQKRNT